MKSARLQTNLLGRKIHLLTDEEAREEARKQSPPLEPEILATVTAENWVPTLKVHRKRFGDQVGEVVIVHLDNECYLIYTISFGGELVELMPAFWRLNLI